VTLKTHNVVHLITDGLDRCYARHSQAVDACPDDDDAKARKATELLLFRKFLKTAARPDSMLQTG
jgi:hypothetical protein